MGRTGGDGADVGVHLLRVVVVQLGGVGHGVIIGHIVALSPLSPLAVAHDPEGVVVFDKVGVVVSGVHAAYPGGHHGGGGGVRRQIPMEAQRGVGVVTPAVEGAVGLEGHGVASTGGNVRAAVHDLGHLVDQRTDLTVVPAQDALAVAAHHPDGAVVFQGHHIVLAQLHILHVGEDDGGVRVVLHLVVAVAVDQIVAPEVEVAVLGHRRAGVVVGGGLDHVAHHIVGLIGLLFCLVVALAQLEAGIVAPGVEVAVFLDDGEHGAGTCAVGDVAVVVVFFDGERGLELHRAAGHRFDAGHELDGDVGCGAAVEQLGGAALTPAVEVAVAGDRPGAPLSRLHLSDVGLARRRGGDGQQSRRQGGSEHQGEQSAFFHNNHPLCRWQSEKTLPEAYFGVIRSYS